jgi:N-acetylglucosaminyl-diphospho-decaprenol L-rhamnosyltransferase
MSPDAPPVAVAIVSFETRELLADCLRSLAADAAEGRAEVWVVDNASGDGSAAMVARDFPWARLIASPRNLGFGAAVNLVAGQTDTAWVAPANADLELGPRALAVLLERGAADPRIGVIGPRLVRPDGSVQPSAQPFPGVATTLLLHSRLYRLSDALTERLSLAPAWRDPRARPVDWVTGAFLLVRRAAWDAAGGFDDRQWMYGEDLDLCWRVRRAGWLVFYEPRAEVRHVLGAAADVAFGDGAAERWLTATYAWLLRRRGVARTRVVAGLNVADALLTRLLLAPLARRDRSGRWERRRREAQAAARAHRVGLAPRRVLAGHR